MLGTLAPSLQTLRQGRPCREPYLGGDRTASGGGGDWLRKVSERRVILLGTAVNRWSLRGTLGSSAHSLPGGDPPGAESGLPSALGPLDEELSTGAWFPGSSGPSQRFASGLQQPGKVRLAKGNPGSAAGTRVTVGAFRWAHT